MTRFFYLSLFCHLLLISSVIFIKTPQPPKVFRAQVYFTPQIKKVITKKTIPKTQQPKKPVTKKLAQPKVVNNSLLKIQNLDLDNLNVIDQITKQIKPILEPRKISEQLPLLDLEQTKPSLENLKTQKQPSLNKQSATESLDINNPLAENIIQNYRNILAAIIKNNWHNSLQNKNLQTLIKASIQKDGQLLSYTVLKKSNIISFDLSVVDALKISTPFPPFPKNYKKEVEIFYFQFQGGGSLISK